MSNFSKLNKESENNCVEKKNEQLLLNKNFISEDM